MEALPLVSVIIPTFNMGRFLPDALESVLAQTYAHFEIHVVDDGSSDDTAKIISRFTVNQRIRYHVQPQRGVAAARNLGIRASIGPLIALCDADDLWSADKLTLQVEAISGKKDVGVVYTEIAAIDAAGEPRETHRVPRRSGKITEALFVGNFVTGSSALIRRRCLDQVGLYDETLSYAEDYDLWLRLSTCCEFLFINRVTYFYRHWAGQSTRNKGLLIDSALHVRQRFWRQNPEMVTKATWNDAWSRGLVDRGLNRLSTDRRPFMALPDMLRALWHAPFSLRAWKSMLRVILRRVPTDY